MTIVNHHGTTTRRAVRSTAAATAALALTTGLLAGTAQAGPSPVYKVLPTTPWYVNDVAGMPAPFRGPRIIDVSAPHAKTLRAHHPNAAPPGADDWNCQPSKEHPNPVILVHGTSDRPVYAWNALAPLLKNAGYCVFAPSYGIILGGNGDGAMDKVENSALQLKAWVELVLAKTRAEKVDIVGHSQGGMMPFYYMNFLDGYKKVNRVVAISPSLRGTDAFGLLNDQAATDRVTALGGDLISPSQKDQMKGSAFLRKLHTRPLTHPSVGYTVITTRYDDVVTPYTSQFLPPARNVKNIVVQDLCSTDLTDHYANIFDPTTLNTVLRALDHRYHGTVPCGVSFPYIGGYVPLPQEGTTTAATATKQALPKAFYGPQPVVMNKLKAQQAGLKDKNATPAGANYFDPALAARHPRPIILVHGTYENASSSWIALAPLLRNAGFNVFTFNYGRMSAQSTAGGIGDLRDSAKELAAEVAKVRALTGARQVDLVGHSLGGLMPHWYLTKLDGWKYVRNVVALAPANKGTFNSITAKFFGMELGPSLDQMLPTSDFVKELWSSGTPTHPAVHYTSIATIYEDAVVPQWSSYLPKASNVTNITLQSTYPLDFADHYALPYDPYALYEVVHALDPRITWTMPRGVVPFYFGGFIPLG